MFTVVNIALLVLRRSPSTTSTSGRPTFLPYVGAASCFFLAGPWARTSEQMIQYKIAGLLLALGIVLWAITWMTNRGIRAKKTGFRDIEHMEDDVRCSVRARYQHGCRAAYAARIIARHEGAVGARRARARSAYARRCSRVDLVARARSGWYAGGPDELLLFQPALLATFLVGWLLVLRRAGGAIGWWLLAHWLVLITFGFASTYAGYAYSPGRPPTCPGARRGRDLGHPRLAAGVRSAGRHRTASCRTAGCSRRGGAGGSGSASLSFARPWSAA